MNDAPPVIRVERIETLRPTDLHDLCVITDDSIKAGGGFGWLKPPPRHVLEAYWRGVLMIPERTLFVGWLDGAVAGSCQVHRPPDNNQAQKFACNLTTHFVVPWARGYGLSGQLLRSAEQYAKDAGFRVINLDVRATQETALEHYRNHGYIRFGRHPYYARVDGRDVEGYYFYKPLVDADGEPDA